MEEKWTEMLWFGWVLISGDLLKYTAEFIDKMMETEEDICTKWSNPELVLAVMEAIKQTGYVCWQSFTPPPPLNNSFVSLMLLSLHYRIQLHSVLSSLVNIYLVSTDLGVVNQTQSLLSTSVSILVAVRNCRQCCVGCRWHDYNLEDILWKICWNKGSFT